jgi:fatty-acyl-CoA synthase
MTRLPDVTVVDVLGSTESGRQGIARTAPGSPGGTAAQFSPESASVVLSEDRTVRLEPGSDEIGWLAKRGLVPRGYLGDRARTEETFPVVDGVRLVVAGDRARVAPDGSIELLGRDSVTINTGGEKVFAEEVESALKDHPAVFDAIVCGLASERWGQEVVAVVQLRSTDDGVLATDDDLRDWCRRSLADFKAPKRIVRVPEVVRSPSGKPDYAWARAVAESEPAG